MRVLPWLAKTAFAAFVASAALGLVAGLGTRFGFWGYRFGLLTLFPWCVYVGLTAFALGLIWALWAPIANKGRGARYGLVGLVGSAAILVAPVYGFYSARTLPAIHDISTDTERPPQFVALKKGRDDVVNPSDYDGPKLAKGPNGAIATTSALQKKYYPDVRTDAEIVQPRKLFDRALEAAQAMGWNIVAVDAKDGRIEATDTTFWFGLTADIAIRVKPAGMGARLDIRSKSREGVTDFGANAARIRGFLKALANTG